MQNEEQRGEQYVRMSELGDYAVSSEDPDPRGWSVIDRDGVAIGRVEDLIIDRAAMKVSYLDIAVSDVAAGSTGRARIPAGRVDLDAAQRTVIADISRAELSAFVGGDLDTTSTRASSSASETFAGMASSDASASDTVADDRTRTAAMNATNAADVNRLTRAEEELRVGTRPVQAGEVVVGKHVETERVSTPVQRRVEHVRIERRPVTDATAANAELREGEIRVPVMEEEVVVEKRPVIKEEIVVTREATTETENVEADVRRERVDVEGDENLIDREGASRTQRAGGGSRG